MGAITTKDGTEIYYKDWGAGHPVVFCHGWPLNADAWESQMVYLGSNGYPLSNPGLNFRSWQGGGVHICLTKIPIAPRLARSSINFPRYVRQQTEDGKHTL